MQTVLNSDDMKSLLARLSDANRKVAEAYPGDRLDRQPVHTVYGGAQLFSADLSAKLGAAAVRTFEEYAPDANTFARALALGGDGAYQRTVYERVAEKLKREPVEDFRIDFEDGYGNRPDAEEDGHAVKDAEETARGVLENLLPPAIGIRIKPLTEELRGRALRTLDLYVGTLVRATGGRLPADFVVTLPKITCEEQVTTMVDVLDLMEQRLGLAQGAIPIELMVETTQSIIGNDGRFMLPALVRAGRGRVRGAHFGVYDYTASCNITARYQAPGHAACDFARHVMQVTMAGTGVTISDGATTIMPVGPHRAAPGGPPLKVSQLAENRAAVHHGWKVHFDDVRAQLMNAYYQGWDLNPAQFPTPPAAQGLVSRGV